MTTLQTDDGRAVTGAAGTTDGPASEAAVATVPALQASGLSRVYGAGGLRRGSRVQAVDNVDISIGQGEIVALVGESGSGKSTVARLLAGLEAPTSGNIYLRGEAVRTTRGRALRHYTKQVQLILQDPFASLNPIHTVRYVLDRSVSIHRSNLSSSEHDAAVRDLLAQVRLSPPERFLKSYPHELSGGQRQRVAIARALGASPSVLLADEPVSMLDVSLRLGVLDLLRDLQTRMRIAILYITHDIASARYFADRILVMRHGVIVESGDSESVTQNPQHEYTRLLIDSAPDPERIGA